MCSRQRGGNRRTSRASIYSRTTMHVSPCNHGRSAVQSWAFSRAIMGVQPCTLAWSSKLTDHDFDLKRRWGRRGPCGLGAYDPADKSTTSTVPRRRVLLSAGDA